MPLISLAVFTVAAFQPAPGTAAPLAVGRGAVQERAAVGAQVQALFARLDRNRDGFVTRDEAQGARGVRGGRRGDRAEVRQRRLDPARQQQRRMAAFDRIDSDRNGVISRAEFERAGQMRVERRAARMERGGGRFMRLGGRMFDMADVNRDARVSLQEATIAAYQRFDLADLNRDGRLTREERQTGRQRMRAERPRG
jgi:Ca2+-binding EF-hand superfamily protein